MTWIRNFCFSATTLLERENSREGHLIGEPRQRLSSNWNRSNECTLRRNSRQQDEGGGHMHAPKTIRALLIASVAVCAITSPLANIGVTSAAAQAASLSAEFHTAL